MVTSQTAQEYHVDKHTHPQTDTILKPYHLRYAIAAWVVIRYMSAYLAGCQTGMSRQCWQPVVTTYITFYNYIKCNFKNFPSSKIAAIKC